jgi:hypothetical protein
MKPSSILPFILAALIAVPAALAESTYEREMKQLRDQRDKAVADATKALTARYQQSLDLVYRRALQAKDPTADAIKTELEILGPLRPAAGAPTAPPPAAGSLPRTMVGTWKVVHIGNHREKWEIKEDGTCAITPGTSQIPDRFCTWSKNKEKIEVRYQNGEITALELPIKSGKLQGTDAKGGRLWLEKDK